MRNVFTSPITKGESPTNSSPSSTRASSSPSRFSISVVDPQEVGFLTRLSSTVSRIDAHYRPQNTRSIQDGREKEFFAFCDEIYARDSYKYVLNDEKVYKFMFFQTFRTQKKRGGRRGPRPLFSLAEYHDVMDRYTTWFSEGSGDTDDIPEPENPIGNSSFAQYRASLRRIWQEQVDQKTTGEHWDHIWTGNCRKLAKLVPCRQTHQKS